MSRVWDQQLKKLERQEQKILKKAESRTISDRIAPIRRKLEKKIPDKLFYTLQAAFEMSFQMLFEKGEGYIEKTYRKDKKQLEHDFLDFAVDKGNRARYIRRMDRQVNKSRLVNTSLSVLEGGVLGFLGIGLPDIPLFLAVVMRNIQEIAMNYGYGHETDGERAYILHVISGALAEDTKAYSDRIDVLGRKIDRGEALDTDLMDIMDETSGIIAESMLVAKFIQGVPVVGVVGGVVNYTIIRKVGRFAAIKYKKRYLTRKKYLTNMSENP